jgi:succinate dehydrogenase/fumarate reductase flavoprotein subunit/HEAT repeat protein
MTSALRIPPVSPRQELTCDVAIVGGGTAGTLAAITAAEHGARVLLFDKAHVRHSGALAMGMDGVNNAVIPGKATPEDYVTEITRANDGIVNQRTVYQTATRGFAMVQRLERYGVKFDKDSAGDYNVRRVHRSGSYVLPMPEGKDIKKVLYRVLRQRRVRERVRIENRVMPVRVLTDGGRAVGLAGFNTRTGEFVTVSAGAVILATGACGRLGLPASGYLYGTYENPTNAGDGHAMAYHAGAELSGLECFQINPLIKDYNGPACAYVANPFGGYQVNNNGERFVDCDYWSGHMMAEVAREIGSARGPIYLKLTHLPEEKISELEEILHTTERPTRGTFHAGRGHDYRTHDVEMHISEIGLCGGHSASGIWVDEHARTTVPGLYAAGDVTCVPHNYMIGAFVFGDLAGEHAAGYAASVRQQAGGGASGPDGAAWDNGSGEAGRNGGAGEDGGAGRDGGAGDGGREPAGGPVGPPLPAEQVAAAHELIYRPARQPDGPPQQQVEYKLRRFVNDYVAPPKTAAKLVIALEAFRRMAGEIGRMGAVTPHELMRCAEVTFIRDCAELATSASLVRTESRWGLYHERADQPGRDDDGWFCHLNVRRGPDGRPEFLRRPVAPYVVPVPEFAGPVSRPAPIEIIGPVRVPEAPAARRGPGSAAGNGHRPAGTARGGSPATARSPRIVELLELAEAQPSVDQIGPYLADPDHRVRRAAIAVLTEVAPPGVGPALARAAGDERGTVRHAAAASLRELAEVLPSDAELAASLSGALASPDPVVRAAVLDVLRQRRLGEAGLFTGSLADPDHRVRLQAVRGLVSRGQAGPVASAAADPSREVRIAVAEGLALTAPVGPETGAGGPGTHAGGNGTVGNGAAGNRAEPNAPARGGMAGNGASAHGAGGNGAGAGGGRVDVAAVLDRLAGDTDPLVRAAALTAAAALGCPPPLAARALAGLADPAWQVRAGAVRALQGAGAGQSAGPLVTAAGDPHADVRKAAVIALGGWATEPSVAAALTARLEDRDADVRAYARRALSAVAEHRDQGEVAVPTKSQ